MTYEVDYDSGTYWSNSCPVCGEDLYGSSGSICDECERGNDANEY